MSSLEGRHASSRRKRPHTRNWNGHPASSRIRWAHYPNSLGPETHRRGMLAASSSWVTHLTELITASPQPASETHGKKPRAVSAGVRRGAPQRPEKSRSDARARERPAGAGRCASPEKTSPEGRADRGRTVVWLSPPNSKLPTARPTHAPASAHRGRQPKRWSQACSSCLRRVLRGRGGG